MKYKDWENKYVRTDKNSIFKNFFNCGKINNKLSNCDSFKALDKYLKNTYDIKITKGVYNLDFDTVKETIEGIESVFTQFPDVSKTVQRAVARRIKGVMSCSGKRLTFNPDYYTDRQFLLDRCKQQSESGHWIKNSSPASIGVHETAHALEWAMIESNPKYTDENARIIAWNSCSEAEQIVLEAIKRIYQNQGNNGIIKSHYALRKSISSYATDSYSETMAEAFADIYANGIYAEPLSTEIVKVTVEQIKKYKGVI